MTVRADVVVVGGGVIGLATAARLAQDGHSVTVIDASGSRGTSWVAAGMLAPVSEATFGERDLTRLNVAAVRRFDTRVAELEELTGLKAGYRTEGTLNVAFDADDRAALERMTAFREQCGLASETLTGSQTRSLEPFLAASVRSGVLAVDDRSVDNRRYLRVLAEACRRGGVTVVADSVLALRQGARTEGVELSSGAVVDAGQTVVCAGVATPELLPDLAPYLQPVKGEILRLRVPDALLRAGGILTRTVRATVRGQEVYLVPRVDGEIVVGATSQHRGRETTVTAGGVLQLLRDAYDVLPVVSECTFVEAIAGLRPGTSDNGPLLDRLDDGLVVAGGHFRNGILLSALTGDAAAQLATAGTVAPEWEPFGLHRFAGRPR